MRPTDIVASFPPGLKRRVAGIGLLLALFNIGAWLAAAIAFHDHPLLLGTAFLAYSFGLRHAVDADHIAAIDNITRKLMQEGKRPVAVGLMFSLGHSTIVALMSLVVAITATALQGAEFAEAKVIGGTISTLVSAFFLLAIAGANLVVLRGTWRSFRHLRAGHPVREEDLTMMTAGGGLMARLLRRLFRMIQHNWQIYLLGLLFGLGFDTATEVGLLGISATGATQGLSPWSIMVFPALFSAGMALVDTADGILMLGAYGWAYVKPIRKLYYNLTITGLSVLVAFLVGGVEVLGLMQDKLGLSGGLWDVVGSVNENFGMLGYGIVGLFILGWVVSVVIYRYAGLDDHPLPEVVTDRPAE